jgi:hypothetical protein
VDNPARTFEVRLARPIVEEGLDFLSDSADLGRSHLPCLAVDPAEPVTQFDQQAAVLVSPPGDSPRDREIVSGLAVGSELSDQRAIMTA